MTPDSEYFRDLIRSGTVNCPRECRHGLPDIWHSSRCRWQPMIEAIYRIERDDLT